MVIDLIPAGALITTTSSSCAVSGSWSSGWYRANPPIYNWFVGDDTSTVEVNLPGYDPKSVSVQLGDMAVVGQYGLIIKAERGGKSQPDDLLLYIPVDPDQYLAEVSAVLNNGLLVIKFIKAEPLRSDVKVKIV
jgi:HSP20 family molecular chaperone IbpA